MADEARELANPPFSDATARRLVALLLEPDEAARLEQAERLIETDAPFATWLAERRREMRLPDESSTSELAGWFCRQRLTLLAQSGDERPMESDESDDAQLLTRLAEKLARLERLESEFAAALEQEKLASLRQLAYGASHEINNPLANISSRAQTLLRDESDPERRRKLATINAQAFRAHEMIADMMLFAKPPRLQIEEVAIAELLDGVAAEMLATAELQQTRIEISFPDDAEAIVLAADPTHLTEALRAMVRNSLEALQGGGQIELGIAADESPDEAGEQWVRITVRDNGPGFDDEVRRHLFDPYFSGREAGRGLGLGLAKAWTIVQLHGGRIDVVSQPQHGCTFTILLPFTDESETHGV
ncbi:MAG: HAMP domain-containing histidine kinase [Planctomycetales bacterium]|nr:HAMP domain-containing histidine kinase [Planctomycetales bacterium]